MRRVWLSTLWLLSCSAGAPSSDQARDVQEEDGPGGGDTDNDTDNDGDVDGVNDGDDDTITQPETDWDLFQDVLAGQRSASETLRQIANSGGWPLAVEGGYLFVRLDDGGGPYSLAGAHTGWESVAMQNQAGVFWVVSNVGAPHGSLYKFIDGDGVYAADPLARAFGYDEYGEYSLVAPAGPHLERWVDLGAEDIEPRTVRVWVPAGTPTHHLYTHDGQNLFDPDAMWGGWHLNESSGSSTLVIGIDNTPARMDEYTHVQDRIQGHWVGGLGDAYADFVELTLRPFIEARYGDPERVGVMGSSLGGLISYHQALRYPGAYDFVASLSGTFGWGSIAAANPTLIELYEGVGCQPSVFYLDSGGSEGSGCADTDGDGTDDDTDDAGDNYCETRQMADLLAAEGCVWNSDLHHWWESGAAHNEAAWAARVFRPLAIFEAL